MFFLFELPQNITKLMLITIQIKCATYIIQYVHLVSKSGPISEWKLTFGTLSIICIDIGTKIISCNRYILTPKE